MPRLGLHNRAALGAGLVTLLLFNLAILILPEAWSEIVRENAFDIVMNADQRLFGAVPRNTSARVVVVDIDRRSLEAIGRWPWSREKMADLAEAIAAARPAVVAFGVLFSEPDDSSPAALARRLATMTDHTDLLDLAKSLPDGDRRMATALASSHAVLGFVLDPERPGSVKATPILARGPLPLRSLWRGAGALGPPDALANRADGLGALSLPANADGVIRRVPLLLGAGDSLLPGLALETVRVQRRASGYTVQANPSRINFADVTFPLPSDALLRLFPVAADRHAERTLSAVDLLQESGVKTLLADATVIVGGSAPELGGLRKTANDPLTPDAQIQADAVIQLLAGRAPTALDSSAVVALSVIDGVGLAMLVAGAQLAPLAGAAVLSLVLALLWAGAASLLMLADRLLDPLTPSVAAVATGEISPKSDQRFAIPYGERGPRSPLVVMIDAHCANGASPMLKIAEKSFDRSFSCCFVLLQQDPEVSLQLQREIFVPEIRAMFEEIRQNLEATASYASFAERHNIQSAATLTVTDAEVAASIAQRLEDRIRGKTVVEIGGGWGLLSLYMGAVARRVYCIEANPMWSMIFTQLLLEIKPKNVSFVFGAADEFVGCIKADIAVICTHSDVSGMKLVGRQLANEIIDVYGEMIDADPEAFDPIARKLRSLT